MAGISAAEVKKLREVTGAGMMDCKAALEGAGGDFDKAVEALRLKGAKDVGKREARTTSNGMVALRTEGTTRGVMVELNCETDFVAKGERFGQLAEELADQVSRTTPDDVEQLLDAAMGGGTVRERLEEASAVLGEKLQLRRFTVVEGAYVASYRHKTSPDLPPQIGVLVELDAEAPVVGKDLAQHIAALPPRWLSRDDVPAEVVEGERRIAEQMARDEGKPEAALPKIVDGRLNGFLKDFVLLEQPFVKDNKKTIAAVCAEAGVSVRRFVRYKVGQD